MNSEYLRTLSDKLAELEIIEESAPVEIELTKAHVEHPEDLIFDIGSNGATQGLQAIINTVKNPDVVTIKWDGYPALIFGTGMDGKFIVADKHMFNKKDGSGHVTSPKAFQQYDIARGVNRPELHATIAKIWPSLQESYSGNGFYWGDLLFSQPLQDENGLYKFKPNPNGILYTVEVDSEIGQLMTGKVGGIAVHNYLPPQATNVQQAQLLNGTIGQLKNNSNVAIIPAKMPTSPKLKFSAADASKIQQVITQAGPAADAWLLQAPAGTKSVFPAMCKVYINKKIVSGNLTNLVGDFYKFFETRPMSDGIRAKLTEHFRQHEDGIKSAFLIWMAVYNAKMKVVPQLDAAAANSPVKGYLDDGRQSHEGFVAYGVKFINRMGFSAQNLGGRR